MAKANKSLDDLIREVSRTAREEISAGLRSAVHKLGVAVAELEEKLEGVSTSKRRAGRPAGKKKSTAAGKRKAAGGARGAKRAPRGALQSAIKEAIDKAGKPQKLSQIRDSVLKHATFRGRDPKTIYTMIVLAIRKMPEVARTATGHYALSGKTAGSAWGRKAANRGRKATKKK
jgi:hypothetical protein